MLVHCLIQLNRIGLHLGKYCLKGNFFLINNRRKRKRRKKKKYVCHQESHFIGRFIRAYSNSLFVSLEQTTLKIKKKEENERKRKKKQSY
jgi:hypothetical protein